MRPRLDEYEQMMQGVITFLVIAFFVAVLVLFFSGCVNAPVAPNLKLPETASCQKMAIKPIPQDAKLIIHGDQIDADQGGEYILRSYVACRAALR